MKPKKYEGDFTVYLLHFDHPVGKKQHYVGITKSPRLHWRMLEHSRGVGSRLTKSAMELGIGFTVANTWRCDSPSYERTIKRGSHFTKRCQVCRSTQVQPPFDLDLVHYQPNQRARPSSQLAWPTPDPKEP